MFGLLNINKPVGVTSRDVVNRIARIAGPAKVGHAGTLDPLASGVLVVCVGPATRLIQYVQRMSKRYRATFLLGRSSETEDLEGEVFAMDDPPIPNRSQLAEAIPRFVGHIEQRPPAFSAIKVQGRRAYDMARAGQAVELEARRVLVDSIELIEYDYPRITLDIACGGGTYIRSLGRDLAESLGTRAVMSELVRTAVGSFHLEDASALDDMAPRTVQDRLLEPVRAVVQLPTVVLNSEQIEHVGHGRMIEDAVAATETAVLSRSERVSEEKKALRFTDHLDSGECAVEPGQAEFAAVDQQGRLRAILIRVAEGRLRASCNFPPSEPPTGSPGVSSS